MSSPTQPTPQEWCDALGYPCAFIGGTIIAQPSSTLLTLVLALDHLLFGVLVLRENRRRGTLWAWTKGHPETGFGDEARERCRAFYGWAMVIWAIAVVFAAAAYQAFTYQLQCTGATPCLDADGRPTLSPDVSVAAFVYLILQCLGQHTLIVGDAYRALRRYAVPVALYGLVATGGYAAFVILFPRHGYDELFMILFAFSAPIILGQLYLQARVRYAPRLCLATTILIASLVVYLAYRYIVDPAEQLARTGVWFSADDALHVVTILYAPALWWAAKVAEDAPPGTALVTETQVERAVAQPRA
mmetsp:Transcript_3651/g.12161  ORF Transcript_3651/g.12161 Transcript_3651/m.12161 type:complete len:302 (-) Transcript_3651:271-1176(-)